MKTIHCKYVEEGTNYWIQCSVGKLELRIKILQQTNNKLNVYKSPVISRDYLETQAKQHQTILDEYFERIVENLLSPEDFSLKITENRLTIHKVAASTKIKVKYFICNLNKVDEPVRVIPEIIDEFYEENKELKSEYERSRRELEDSKVQIEELKSKLDELVQRKCEDEHCMLSNFVSVLNEKKRKIQHLHELLENSNKEINLGGNDNVAREYVSESEDSNYNTTDSEDTGTAKTDLNDNSDDLFHEIFQSDSQKSSEEPTEAVSISTKFKSQEAPSCSNINEEKQSRIDVDSEEVNTQDFIDNL